MEGRRKREFLRKLSPRRGQRRQNPEQRWSSSPWTGGSTDLRIFAQSWRCRWMRSDREVVDFVPEGLFSSMQQEAGHLQMASRSGTESVDLQKNCREWRTLDQACPQEVTGNPAQMDLDRKGKPLAQAVKIPRSGLHPGVQMMPSALGLFPSLCYVGSNSQVPLLSPWQQWNHPPEMKYGDKHFLLEVIPQSWR